VLNRWAFPHSEAGWLMTVDRLRRQGLPEELPVIVERTSGLVVDRLLSAGHPVVPVHPTAFFAARPRWGASGVKSDPGDSYKLADYLHTDAHRLRRLAPVDPGLQELQGSDADPQHPHSWTPLEAECDRGRAAVQQGVSSLDAPMPKRKCLAFNPASTARQINDTRHNASVILSSVRKPKRPMALSSSNGQKA
jgi:hypothetical protein